MKISRIAKPCFFGCTLATTALAADVTLTVDDVKTGNGQILASLCDDPQAVFPGSCRTYAAKAPAQAGATIVIFKDVKPGTYAIQVAHDENGNGRPDFPQEGFAFGNDMAFPPTFAGASIAVSGDTAAHVRLLHMLSNGTPNVGTNGAPPPEGVTKTDLRDDGLYGALYVPAARKEPLPLLIAIGGSEGGLDIMSSHTAAFARHGYAVLALAWWKESGLPQSIENVPLEYFDRAIAWAKARPEIAPGRIAMLGWSRGAEAALLVAARNRAIHGVIGVAPSAFVWTGLNFASPGASKPAWTVAGVPLPHVTPGPFRPGAPMAQMFMDSLALADARPEVSIPVENIQAPVLLLSGSDDRIWPSHEMAQRIGGRLRTRNFAYSFEHKNYEGAGHSIFIGDPAAPRRPDSASIDAFMGGSAQANSAARADSWQRVLRFLDVALKPKG
ncbi:MAG TPA: acyl-CoA thioester hydrolase/BAAT C-terminal domain-containing protein [Rhizomicrobium sp.]|nr:acyl-CoA thioester hydrolase/BAAT C-terminal domain-containing protein [Rhizomicrobium sp.]